MLKCFVAFITIFTLDHYFISKASSAEPCTSWFVPLLQLYMGVCMGGGGHQPLFLCSTSFPKAISKKGGGGLYVAIEGGL